MLKMTCEWFLIFLLFSFVSSFEFSGDISDKSFVKGVEYKSVIFTDPELGTVERTYIQYIPSTYTGEVPVALVLDFHGYTMSGQDEMDYDQWHVVAEENGFIAVFMDGMNDTPTEARSWNINDETGRFGDPCDRDREKWGVYECNYSCEGCDPQTTCKEGMTCYNDVAFVEFMVLHLQEELSIDPTRIHATGLSNGAQFAYFLASYSTHRFASYAPVAGVPFLSFGLVPPTPVSIIDFHGVKDSVIPYDIEHGEAFGNGPHSGLVSTLIAYDGMYYYDKAEYLTYVGDTWGCGPQEAWPTPMDGHKGWSCVVRACGEGVDIVSCTGNYGHGYPSFFDDPFNQGEEIKATRILWQFMENRTSAKK